MLEFEYKIGTIQAWVVVSILGSGETVRTALKDIVRALRTRNFPELARGVGLLVGALQASK